MRTHVCMYVHVRTQTLFLGFSPVIKETKNGGGGQMWGKLYFCRYLDSIFDPATRPHQWQEGRANMFDLSSKI
jgi:hypothetical protein